MTKWVAYLVVAVVLAADASAQTTGKPASPSLSDVLTTTFSASCADLDAGKLALGSDMTWSDKDPLFVAVKNRAPSCSGLAKFQAYVFHVTRWKGTEPNGAAPYTLLSSLWYVYRADVGAGKLRIVALAPNGEPLLYGTRGAVIVGIDVFESGTADAVRMTYKTSVTAGTPANIQNLSQLVVALLGATLPTKGQNALCSVAVAAYCQEGARRLPFDFNIAATAALPDSNGKFKDNSSSQQSSTAGVIDCPSLDAGGACTFKRKFTSEDREWWDVSLGVTTPGVRETQFSFSNGTVVQKVTTHTNLYAMFDVYPFAARWPKNSPLPNLSVGLPVTSQTFYRPFFGGAWNLTSWTGLQRAGFPLTLSFFAGVVYMKTTVIQGTPTTAAQFTADSRSVRVLKPLFGIEVPVTALISKVGKSSSKSPTSTSAPTKSSGTTGP